jgi:opacity protein-like surface antigen
MKKLLLTAAIAVFTLSSVNAQDITFGAKAGINIANLDVTDANIDSRTSLHLGVTAEFEISDTFSIQPELLYSAQGATESETYEDSFVRQVSESEWKLNYIQIPIMAKFYVSEGLSLEAGPQIGFLASAEVDSDSTETSLFDGSSVSTSSTVDAKEIVKSVDFGLNFGLGYKLDSGLNFALRYNLGLSNIYDVSETDVKIKNRVFQLSVGYTF